MNYSDKSLYGNRKYELREKTFFATGDRFCEASFETELPYEMLSPYFDKLLVSSILTRVGKPVTFVGLLITLIFVGAKRLGFETEFLYSGALLFVGLLLMIFGRRKLEIAQFKSVSGTPMVIIVKAGKEKERFDEFVSELLKRIQAATRSS